MKISRKLVYGIVAVILVAVIVGGVGAYLWLQPKPNTQTLHLVLGTAPALTIDSWPRIALTQGFFVEEGLTIEEKMLPGGQQIIEAMAAGDVDIAHVGTSQVVTLVAANTPVHAIAESGRSIEYSYLIMGKEFNITTPKDLEGHSIGTQFGSVAHTALLKLIQMYNLTASKISIVNLSPPAAVVAGYASYAVDGVMVHSPFCYQSSNSRPSVFLHSLSKSYFPSTFGQPEKLVDSINFIVARDDIIKSNAPALKAYLRAILKAQTWLSNPANLDEYYAIMANSTKSDIVTTKTSFSDLALKIQMTTDAPTALNDFASFLYAQGKIARNPTAVEMIHTDLLKEVAPEAVYWENSISTLKT